MAFMDISVVPIGTGSPGVGRFVREIHRVLSGLGLPFFLHDMGTTVEGGIEDLLHVARILHEAPFSLGEDRVYTVIKIDDRRDRVVRLGEKAASVMGAE